MLTNNYKYISTMILFLVGCSQPTAEKQIEKHLDIPDFSSTSELNLAGTSNGAEYAGKLLIWSPSAKGENISSLLSATREVNQNAVTYAKQMVNLIPVSEDYRLAIKEKEKILAQIAAEPFDPIVPLTKWRKGKLQELTNAVLKKYCPNASSSDSCTPEQKKRVEQVKLSFEMFCQAKVMEFAFSPLAKLKYKRRPIVFGMCEDILTEPENNSAKVAFFAGDECKNTQVEKSYYTCFWQSGVFKTFYWQRYSDQNKKLALEKFVLGADFNDLIEGKTNPNCVAYKVIPSTCKLPKPPAKPQVALPNAIVSSLLSGDKLVSIKCGTEMYDFGIPNLKCASKPLTDNTEFTDVTSRQMIDLYTNKKGDKLYPVSSEELQACPDENDSACLANIANNFVTQVNDFNSNKKLSIGIIDSANNYILTNNGVDNNLTLNEHLFIVPNISTEYKVENTSTPRLKDLGFPFLEKDSSRIEKASLDYVQAKDSFNTGLKNYCDNADITKRCTEKTQPNDFVCAKRHSATNQTSIIETKDLALVIGDLNLSIGKIADTLFTLELNLAKSSLGKTCITSFNLGTQIACPAELKATEASKMQVEFAKNSPKITIKILIDNISPFKNANSIVEDRVKQEFLGAQLVLELYPNLFEKEYSFLSGNVFIRKNDMDLYRGVASYLVESRLTDAVKDQVCLGTEYK